MAMRNKTKKIRASILHKIFWVILALTSSFIMFILAFWGMIISKPSSAGAHIHLAATFIILIVVGMLVAHYIIKKILKPLSKLNEAVDKAGKGNFDQTIIVTSNDELGVLTEAFNKMASDIKKMIVAREQLLLDVSHELRSPITRAKLALEMMPDSPEKESIASDMKEMETMVTEILESERLKNGAIAGNLTPIGVKELLESVLEVYQKESNRITLFPVSSDITIIADKNLMITVLRNLIDNSLKYSTSNNKPIEISVIQHNDNVTIQIEDYGSGIPEDKLPYIFEPFYRADLSRSRKTGGYGLGLHLCKRIMDVHGAEIFLKNRTDNQGLIVTLKFS